VKHSRISGLNGSKVKHWNSATKLHLLAAMTSTRLFEGALRMTINFCVLAALLPRELVASIRSDKLSRTGGVTRSVLFAK
jgi:hypothetical protein